MNTEQFAYWLQGFAELTPTAPTQEQWDSIRDHLATVFVKVTPPVVIPTGPVKREPSIFDQIRQDNEKRYIPSQVTC